MLTSNVGYFTDNWLTIQFVNTRSEQTRLLIADYISNAISWKDTYMFIIAYLDIEFHTPSENLLWQLDYSTLSRAGVKYGLSNTNTNTNIFFSEFQIQIQIQIHRQKFDQIQIQIQIQSIKYKYNYKYAPLPIQNCRHFTDDIFKFILL